MPATCGCKSSQETGPQVWDSIAISKLLRTKHILRSHIYKVNLWKCVEILQHGMENQKVELSHFHPEVETEHSNTRVTKSLSCDTEKKGFGTLT